MGIVNSKPISVLVVDDSAFMRKRIADILSSDNAIRVVGVARNGKDALKMIVGVRPDVVTLDLQMPEMDGLTCLAYIMSECPVPVVVISGYQEAGRDLIIEALEYGAVDFVAKPSGVISLDIGNIAAELLDKVKLAGGVRIAGIRKYLPKEAERSGQVNPGKFKNVVTIGSSTGGPKALSEILPEFPEDIPAAILVVQHMPAGFTNSMAKRLNWQSKILVKEAEDGDILKSGHAYVAPGNYQMLIDEGGIIRLTNDPPEKGTRPTIDVTMRSVAPLYAERNIGIILTGMGNDGTEGLKMIRNFGGVTIAQDEADCIVFGMPKNVIKNNLADHVLRLPEIPGKVARLIGRT